MWDYVWIGSACRSDEIRQQPVTSRQRFANRSEKQKEKVIR